MGKVVLYPSPQEIAVDALSNESEEALAVALTNMANAGDPAAVELVAQVIAGGGLDEMHDAIASLIDDIEISIRPSREKKTGKLAWEPVSSTDGPVVPSSSAAYALVLSRIDSAGIVDRIRQCQECGKYFVGDPRSKWCSKNCGSRNRQRIYQEGLRKKKKAKKRTTK